jgi:hypothetical protein
MPAVRVWSFGQALPRADEVWSILHAHPRHPERSEGSHRTIRQLLSSWREVPMSGCGEPRSQRFDVVDSSQALRTTGSEETHFHIGKTLVERKARAQAEMLLASSDIGMTIS